MSHLFFIERWIKSIPSIDDDDLHREHYEHLTLSISLDKIINPVQEGELLKK